MDQLDIILVNVDIASNGGGGKGRGGPRSGGGDGSGIGQVTTDILSSQIFLLYQIVGGMRNKVISLIFDQRRHINTLNANVKHIALVPDMRGVAAVPLTTAYTVLHLSKCPRDLWVCVCVCLTSSREGLPSDAIPIAGQIHPSQCLRRHTPSRLRTSASPWGDVS
jgi:hypothetical protein